MTRFMEYEINGFSELVDAKRKIDEFQDELVTVLRRLVDDGIHVKRQLDKVSRLSRMEAMALMAAISVRQCLPNYTFWDVIEELWGDDEDEEDEG